MTLTRKSEVMGENFDQVPLQASQISHELTEPSAIRQVTDRLTDGTADFLNY
jgi:hypothetical protein